MEKDYFNYASVIETNDCDSISVEYWRNSERKSGPNHGHDKIKSSAF